MPELPEVETVRSSLALELPGLRVTAVGGRSIAMRRPLDVELLAERVTGRRFLEPRRRGKYLLLDLEPQGSLLAHLGMSGNFQLVDPFSTLRKHTHLLLDLENGRQLRFIDPRRFGFVDWLEPGEEATDGSLAALGIEPLHPGLDGLLPPLYHARRAPLKSLLLDQRLVTGIGNIYAIEALWRAGIHPRRAGNRTSLPRLAVLARSVQEVLLEAITQGGTTLRDFAGTDGEAGYFAVKLSVYGRQGEPCTKCGSEIRAEVIAGRTTSWCSNCQN
jgi:formamidopyrimidine-DNA glycosylase